MKRLKVGFVLDDTLDTTDGVQQYVMTLGTWLTGQGHEVHYLVGETTRDDMAHVHSLSRNMQVRFNGNRMSIPLPARRQAVKRLLEAKQFDVLHVQLPYSPWLAQRIIQAAPARTAVIGTFHIAPHSRLVQYATRGLALWTKPSIRRFDRIVSVSQAAADFARQTYNLHTDILPNVVELERFQAAAAFERYADIPMILFLGRLVPRKGCAVLLAAAARLHAEHPELAFRVVICGRGPLEASLRNFVQQHGLAEIVEFTGFISEVDKPRYLASAALAVFPSSGGESFGIVLIETMAAGHAVALGADNPGYRAVLSPYPDSLFPVNDVPGLASRIERYLNDRHYHQAALDWQTGYVKQFDVAVVGARLEAIYHCEHERRAA